MSKTAFLVAALFAANTSFADTPAPKVNPAPQVSAKTQPQAAGGQSGGANGVVVAGGATQSTVNPALIALGVAAVAVVVAASLSSDSSSSH